MSLADRNPYGQTVWGLSLHNYLRLFDIGILRIFARTIFMATATAAVCASVGLIVAWAMATAPKEQRDLSLMVIVVPFLTNGLIRILGIKAFVSVGGPLDVLLETIGIPHDPFSFTANVYLVAVGLVICCLPFAVLPLYGAFEKFDFSLIEAAQDLGASQWTILSKVIFPVLFRPFMSGFFLVFIPCLGEYLTPDLLGGARTQLLGNVITDKFLKTRDWPMGCTLAMTLVLILLIGQAIVSWTKGQKNHER